MLLAGGDDLFLKSQVNCNELSLRQCLEVLLSAQMMIRKTIHIILSWPGGHSIKQWFFYMSHYRIKPFFNLRFFVTLMMKSKKICYKIWIMNTVLIHKLEFFVSTLYSLKKNIFSLGFFCIKILIFFFKTLDFTD